MYVGRPNNRTLCLCSTLARLIVRYHYHMRQLRTVRKMLTTDAVKMLVQALVASQLDYCNSIFHLISAASLQAVQSLLNAAARLVMRKRKYDRITDYRNLTRRPLLAADLAACILQAWCTCM